MGKGFLLCLIQFNTICLSVLYAQSNQRSVFLTEDQRTIKGPIPIQEKSSYKAKLSSELNILYEKYVNQEAFSTFADRAGLTIENNAVEVTLLLERNFQINRTYIEQLKQFGVRIEATSRHSLSAQIPIPVLIRIIDRFPGIVQIRRPLRPKETAVTSEGVALMNADTWHSAGHEGAGVKVAIIDGGFNQLTAAQAAGDIPPTYSSHDFSSTGLQSGTVHGTAVAEAIYDVAPLAALYLYKIANFTHFENAKDSCIANGIHIVNHSMGWFNTGGYYDGTGYACDVASDAIANNILWVNAAGNSAEDHYRAIFNPDANNYHTYGTGNINLIGPEPGYYYFHPVGQVVSVAMNWNNYPTTGEDYNLYLLRWNGSGWDLIDYSINNQNGSIPPEEEVYYINDEVDAIYGIVVEQFSATSNADFTLFSRGLGLSYHTTSNSIIDPASVTDVITVGAIGRIDYDAGPQEYFSSQGPTTDGRIKPDIMAPDDCISFAYGYWYGTSLASPHTAGICAVIKSSSPGYSNAQIKDYLYTDTAIDLGDAGKDNIYGWGKIGLSDSPLPVTLSHFNAHMQDSGILIEWITASELNNASWIIEKKPEDKFITAPSSSDPNLSDTDDGYRELIRIEGYGNTSASSNYQYLDTDVSPDTYYRYRLADISYSGKKTYHYSVLAAYKTPVSYRLDQNYPNPFNPTTMISYQLPKTSEVKLSVYNLSGQKMATLVSQIQQAGYHQVEWDAGGLASGIYYFLIKAGEFKQVKKMVLLR
jgi:hypothetical protein